MQSDLGQIAGSDQYQPLIEFDIGTNIHQIFVSVLAKYMAMSIQIQLINHETIFGEKIYNLYFNDPFARKELLLYECPPTQPGCNKLDNKVNSLYDCS
jgi:hypothetical protein